jgi:Dopey and related predicted leucine zipper transcription factors
VCASLDDSNVLVQRITLDFVISFITFHSTTLCEKHVVKLLTYALGVLLRRDMSLNRRIFQWFLNVTSEGNPVHRIENEENKDDDVNKETCYFDLYVREPLTISMIILFQNVLESVEGAFEAETLTTKHRQTHLKPFRILITLLDKPEVGTAILNDIMLEIFRTLYKHSQLCNKLVDISVRIGKDINTMHSELIKNANLLFSSLEPYFIWEYLSKVLKRCVTPNMTKSSEVDSVSTVNGEASGFSSLIDLKVPTHLETFNMISYLLDVVSLVSV